MGLRCTHHCRACGKHFRSLAAFDTHRISEGDGPGRGCFVPDKDEEVTELFVGYAGTCSIADATTTEGTVWELVSRRAMAEQAA